MRDSGGLRHPRVRRWGARWSIRIKIGLKRHLCYQQTVSQPPDLAQFSNQRTQTVQLGCEHKTMAQYSRRTSFVWNSQQRNLPASGHWLFSALKFTESASSSYLVRLMFQNRFHEHEVCDYVHKCIQVRPALWFFASPVWTVIIRV